MASPDEGHPSKRAKLDSSLTTLPPLLQCSRETPTLLTLPGEIRNEIYGYLLPDDDWLEFIHIPGLAKENDYLERNYAILAHTCMSLRNEFLPLFLSKIEIHIFEWEVECYVKSFSKAYKSLKKSKASLLVDLSPEPDCWNFKNHSPIVELMSLLRLSIEAPTLTVSFSLDHYYWRPTLENLVAQDLNALFVTARENTQWAQEILNAVQSIDFYPWGRARPGGPEWTEWDDLNADDACLEITYKKTHKETWMGGTHSFDELKAYLEEMGLDAISLMDVRVGVASMSHKGIGKGRRTQEQRDTLDWLKGKGSEPKKLKDH